MSTLSDLLAEHTAVPGSAVAHLQQLVSEWQLLGDLSFSDLTMWVPTDSGSLVCVAQVRPTTASTVHADDLVSRQVQAADEVLLRRGWEEERIVAGRLTGVPDRVGEDPAGGRGAWPATVGREVIPVRSADTVVALLVRDFVSRSDPAPASLDTAYLEAAGNLFAMVADGTFPAAEQPGEMHTGPRAGDGLLRLDPAGRVVYVSPNALSAYHRLGFTGDVLGAELAAVTRSLVADPFDAAELASRITDAVGGRPSLRMEVEARGATVLFRSLPLRPQTRPAGALVLVRDVTEVRRRDRALLSKDATIREIHHRVKNNLQTVAALLRLQARRSDSVPVRRALSESVRRVSSIALIHQTLSASPDDRVDLDQIVDRLVPILSEVSAPESPARVQRVGSFGVVGAELATPLVMVLAEIAQNALQHAFRSGGPGGDVTIHVQRSAKALDIRVVDDGIGLPAGFSLERTTGLGLQIVRTLVDSELRGSISMRAAGGSALPGGASALCGTEVVIRVPLKGWA